MYAPIPNATTEALKTDKAELDIWENIEILKGKGNRINKANWKAITLKSSENDVFMSFLSYP